VIVQALDTDARALRHAVAHDADGFLAGELSRRELLRYPPYSSLIRVVCSAREPGPEARAADAVAAHLDMPGLSVLGPAPLFRLKGRDRAQLIVKAPASERAAAVRAVRRAVESVSADKAHRGAAYSVDVDPQ
jgi:primosomal protein N' (replication factor Y)